LLEVHKIELPSQWRDFEFHYRENTRQLNLKYILYSLICGFIITSVMHLPFLGVLIALTAFPLGDIYPELTHTSAHVEIGFAWIILKSAFAWLAYWLYFSLTSLPFIILVQVFKKIKRSHTKRS